MTTISDQQRQLGRLLLAGGPITQERLTTELAQSGKDRSVLGQALLKSGFVTEEELLSVLLQRHRMPRINIKNTKIPLSTIRQLPEPVARQSRSLPIDRFGAVLVVVTPDVLAPEAVESIRKSTDCLVAVIQCGAEGFDEALDSYYRSLGPETAAADLGVAAPRAATGLAAPIPADESEVASAVPVGPGFVDVSRKFDLLYASAGPVPAEEVLL